MNTKTTAKRVRRNSDLLKKAFKDAVHSPTPTPGPGPHRFKSDLKEFPLHRDPLFERKYMEERISHWVPDLARVLGVNPKGLAIVTPAQTYLASDIPALLWLLFADLIISRYRFIPDWMISRLAPQLNKISSYLIDKDSTFIILRQEGN